MTVRGYTVFVRDLAIPLSLFPLGLFPSDNPPWTFLPPISQFSKRSQSKEREALHFGICLDSLPLLENILFSDAINIKSMLSWTKPHMSGSLRSVKSTCLAVIIRNCYDYDPYFIVYGLSA